MPPTILKQLAAAILLILIAAVASAWAEADNRELEEETVRRCLADLASQDPAVRHRAVLLIGKYQTPVARQAVVRALGDEAEQVRLSALVALSENQAVSPDAVEAVFRLLTDPSPHLRRMASSMLGELPLFPQSWPGGGIIIAPDADIQGRQPGAAAKFAGYLNHALGDSDEIVLKNVLSAAARFPDALDHALLIKHLGHPEQGVRGLAMRACLTAMQGPELAKALAPLARDPEAALREELAGSLPRLGQAGLPLLRALAADTAPAVRLRAAGGLARLRDLASMPLIAAVFEDQELPAGDRKAMIPYLVHLGKDGAKLVLRAAETPGQPLRGDALLALGTSPGQLAPLEFFMAALNDPAREVRQAVVAAVMARRQEVRAEHVEAMFRSPFPEVRQACLQFTHGLPPDKRAAILGELLLDDNNAVRAGAIAMHCRLAVPGWPEILRLSLDDAAAEIRTAAVNALLSVPFPEAAAILDEFLPRCQDPALAERIRNRLAQLGRLWDRAAARPCAPRPRHPGGTRHRCRRRNSHELRSPHR